MLEKKSDVVYQGYRSCLEGKASKSLLYRVKYAIDRSLITYYRELERAIGNVENLLDIGCGSESPITHLRGRIGFTIGVDAFEPSIEESRQEGIHNDYYCLDLREITSVFSAKSFDCVLASDVIEHLTKEEGSKLMADMEEISRARVVIFTPNGFLPQSPTDENPMQRHRSGWTVEEMRRNGYEVIGINGWKPLLGEFALPRFRPRAVWAIVSRITQFFVRDHPEYAFQILCVKDLNVQENGGWKRTVMGR